MRDRVNLNFIHELQLVQWSWSAQTSALLFKNRIFLYAQIAQSSSVDLFESAITIGLRLSLVVRTISLLRVAANSIAVICLSPINSAAGSKPITTGAGAVGSGTAVSGAASPPSVQDFCSGNRENRFYLDNSQQSRLRWHRSKKLGAKGLESQSTAQGQKISAQKPGLKLGSSVLSTFIPSTEVAA